MTRRTHWPEEDSGGPASSRAEAGPPRTGKPRSPRARRDRGPGGMGGVKAGQPGADVQGGAEHLAVAGDRVEDGTAERELPGPAAEEQDPAERARAICLRLLTGSARTRQQLAEALRQREVPDEVAEDVLSRLEEVGLVDDAAFADAWVESRHHSRGLARRALVRELRTKGVDAQLIDDAVGQLDQEQEAATARELVDRKLRATRGLEREKRIRRLAGMLARKGYSQGLALRVVRQALEDEGEDPELLESHLPDT